MRQPLFALGWAALLAAASLVLVPYIAYVECLVEVPNRHMAILTHKVGRDIDNGDTVAPTDKPLEYKGIQPHVLTEGRYFYNPYAWSWLVVPQIDIPEGKLGVRVRLMARTCRRAS